MVVDREFDSYAIWKPTKVETKIAGATRMFAYYQWLNTYIGLRKSSIDMVVVEELAVMRGAKVARTLAHFEAIACVVPMKHNLMVVRVKAGTARNLVLGIPITASKEVTLTAVRERYPDVKWPPKNQGGEDVADAFVMALAGPLAAGR